MTTNSLARWLIIGNGEAAIHAIKALRAAGHSGEFHQVTPRAAFNPMLAPNNKIANGAIAISTAGLLCSIHGLPLKYRCCGHPIGLFSIMYSHITDLKMLLISNRNHSFREALHPLKCIYQNPSNTAGLNRAKTSIHDQVPGKILTFFNLPTGENVFEKL